MGYGIFGGFNMKYRYCVLCTLSAVDRIFYMLRKIFVSVILEELRIECEVQSAEFVI